MDWKPAANIDIAIPRSVDDLGVPEALVHDIVLRQAVAMGRTSTTRLSSKLALSPGLMTKVVEDLRDLHFLEVQGIDGRDYRLAPTEKGRQQANDRMQISRYVGPVPVTLAAYTDVIRRQHANPHINLAALKAAFSDLVISDALLAELGPAAIAGGAMFLYGPPGTGKSSIAERLLRIYGDLVLVPHAVEVDGQIINVFDPVVHRPADEQPSSIDRRWVLCHRPCLMVGGELGPEMLDLKYQRDSGTYVAPVQMQANNGILVIDDFGRQAHLSPEALLNRWIVPLDRQRDHLMLDHGTKFDIPFDAKIVFSTNLQPETLGDEAFFRRIQSKVLIPSIDGRRVRRDPAAGVRGQPDLDDPRRLRAPPAHEPRAGRRRPAALPPWCRLQDPDLDLHLRGPSARAAPRDDQPHRPHVLHPHRRPR